MQALAAESPATPVNSAAFLESFFAGLRESRDVLCPIQNLLKSVRKRPYSRITAQDKNLPAWINLSEPALGYKKSMNTFALVMPGPTEWVLILVIVLVLFGAKKLPELARSLGQGMNEFRKVREEFGKELQQAGQDLKGQPQSTQQGRLEQPAPAKTSQPS